MTTTAEETARAWCAVDPDPTTRAETERRLAASDEAWIREGFSGRLSFGTAGMRGPIGPGPNRMNRLTVRRVTRALALHVLEQGGTSAPKRRGPFRSRPHRPWGYRQCGPARTRGEKLSVS